MGGVTGSDGGHRPRILVGMGSGRRGGPDPKTPTGRHAGCTRRHSHELAQSPTEVAQAGIPTSARSPRCLAGGVPEDSTPRRTGRPDPMGGIETKTLAKARYKNLQGAGATAYLRARPTDSLRLIHAEGFLDMGRRFIGIEEQVAVRCPCCDTVDVCSGRGHSPRAHLSQSGSAGKPTLTARPRNVPYVEAAGNSTPSGKRQGVHDRPKSADGHCRQERRSTGCSP